MNLPRVKEDEVPALLERYKAAYEGANGVEPPFELSYGDGYVDLDYRGHGENTRYRYGEIMQMTRRLEIRVNFYGE